MNELVVGKRIPEMSLADVEQVRSIEKHMLEMPQIPIRTDHCLHAGMYSRTVMIPADVMITGVLIKIATMLIVSGSAIVYVGDHSFELHGYNVLPASAHRKQAFVAKTDMYLTMIFPCNAESIEEAEKMFTDEYHLLASHNSSNNIMITGD